MAPTDPPRGGARSTVVLALFLLVSAVVATSGALFNRPGEWYAGLAKPPWTPPPALFGPVWAVLYAAMAVAAWLVWRRAGWRGAADVLVVYAAQLALNAAWSWLFFSLHSPGAALVDILVLAGAIAATMHGFRRHSAAAAALLLPYLLWVVFASALNFAIWQLNG